MGTLDQLHAEEEKNTISWLSNRIPSDGIIFRKTLPDSIKNNTDPFFYHNWVKPQTMNLTKKNSAVYLSSFFDDSNQWLVYKITDWSIIVYHSNDWIQTWRTYSKESSEYKKIIKRVKELLDSRNPQATEECCASAEQAFALIYEPTLRNLHEWTDSIENAINKLCAAYELQPNYEQKIWILAKIVYASWLMTSRGFRKHTATEAREWIIDMVKYPWSYYIILDAHRNKNKEWLLDELKKLIPSQRNNDLRGSDKVKTPKKWDFI